MVTLDAQTAKELGVMRALWEAKRELASASGGRLAAAVASVCAPAGVRAKRSYDRLRVTFDHFAFALFNAARKLRAGVGAFIASPESAIMCLRATDGRLRGT